MPHLLPQWIQLVLALCEVSWPSVWPVLEPVLSRLWSAQAESVATVAGSQVVLILVLLEWKIQLEGAPTKSIHRNRKHRG